MRFFFGNIPSDIHGVFCLLCCSLYLTVASAQEQEVLVEDGPRRIDFSKHSDKEGRIDYANAMNTYFSKGVTPENNAAVKILAQIDPLFLNPDFIALAWQRLGVDPPKKPGTWLIWRDELDRLGIKDEEEREKLAPPTDQVVQSWSRKDYPVLAAWLDRMDAPLAAIEQASYAPNFWMPFVGEKGTTVDAHLLPHLLVFRHLAFCLADRVGLAINEERFDDAIRDVGTMRRLARYLRKGSIPLEQMVGVSMGRISQECVIALCTPGRLNTEQLETLLEVVQTTRSHRLRMHLAFDTVQRAIALETFERVIEKDDWQQPVLFPQGNSNEETQELLSIFHSAMNHTGFDRDIALTCIQNNFDDCYKIAAIPSYGEFQSASRVYDAGFTLARDLNPEVLIHGARDNLKPMDEKQSKSYTLSVTYRLLDLVRPLFTESRTERQGEAYEEMAHLAIKVSIYHAKRGRYPADLKTIHAGNLKDPFDQNRTLVYVQQDDSFTIYSVGLNQKDDRGMDDPKDGDLVIRVK